MQLADLREALASAAMAASRSGVLTEAAKAAREASQAIAFLSPAAALAARAASSASIRRLIAKAISEFVRLF